VRAAAAAAAAAEGGSDAGGADAGGAPRRGVAERVRLLQQLHGALCAPAGDEGVAARLAAALHAPFAQEAEAAGGALAAAERAVAEEVRAPTLTLT